MRPENKRMKNFLKENGIDATPKYYLDGSMKGLWHIYNTRTAWTKTLCDKFNALGFVNTRQETIFFSENSTSFLNLDVYATKDTQKLMESTK